MIMDGSQNDKIKTIKDIEKSHEKERKLARIEKKRLSEIALLLTKKKKTEERILKSEIS